MSIQHLHPPQHLALAIALALGCADVSMAQPSADILTTAEQQEYLKAFAEAAMVGRTAATWSLGAWEQSSSPASKSAQSS